MNARLARLATAALSATALGTAASAGHVWVVKTNSEFTQAVAAAQSGDIVLLKTGNYSSASITSRSVSLVAEKGVEVTFAAPFSLVNATDQTPVLLQGLRFRQNVVTLSPFTFSASGFAGPLWVDRCLFNNEINYFTSAASSAMMTPAHFQGCQSLVVHHSAFFGADAQTSGQPGDGVRFGNSSATLHNCVLRGGTSTAPGSGYAGGAGARATGGFLLASGCYGRGGGGASGSASAGNPSQCTQGSDGGAAIALASAASLVQLGSDLAGGAGGPAAGLCGPGADGPAIDAQNGVLTSLVGAARDFEISSPVREGQQLAWTLSGAPGDLAFIDYAAQPGFLYLESLRGALVLAPPISIVYAGVVPQSGVLAGNVTIHDLGPGVEGVILWAQAGFLEGSSIYQAAPSASLLLDQAF
jgi:hypothetical protein